jgi:hypothetical protein
VKRRDSDGGERVANIVCKVSEDGEEGKMKRTGS